MWMKEVSRISDLRNFPGTNNVTFSQALEAGLTHSNWLSGELIGKYGRDPALVSHSVRPAGETGQETRGTYGPPLDGLYPSAGLQRYLENRLRESLEGYGSMEYDLTWKHWDMLLGPPILRRRALARRTSGKGCGGWPTSRTITGGAESAERKKQLGRKKSGGGDLQAVAAEVDGWPTPNTMMGGQTSRGGKRKKELLMSGIVKNISGWATPKASEDKSATTGVNIKSQVFGMENKEGYRLNPYFSLWLMGYPIEWGFLADPVMQSCRK